MTTTDTPESMPSTETPEDMTDVIVAEVREGEYGARIAAVEPGGAEFIPLADRHGKPISLFWTWMSPNLEFATVFVGVIAVLFFGLTVWQAIAALVLGNLLGSLSHGYLSARGPLFGVPQMILSRIPFGFRGNILPAGLNAVIAGVGWFAVNSVSGAFALSTLTGMPKELALLIVVIAQITIAFLGHNFLQAFERLVFPVLAIAFILAYIVIAPKADFSAVQGGGGLAGFMITLGAAFGYAAGWNPYAADYTRYLPVEVSKVSTGLWAGLGVFISCTALEILGVLSATIAAPADASPTAAFTAPMPSLIADLVLLAIFIGAVSANAINVYSGTMSFLALGVKLPMKMRRAIVAIAFGVLGSILAFYGLSDVSKYENFLLVIAYWIGPWLGVVFTDQYLRRRHTVDGFLFDRKHNPWAGFLAMAIAMAVSIWGFSNQVQYVGPVPTAIPEFGDSAFEVGFVLAAVLYAVFFKLQKDKTDEVLVMPS
jgi:NCS1 family nucleobase:cation symporter-1